MRTSLICFENKYFNGSLENEKNVLALLNANAVFVDFICVIPFDDKKAFIEAFNASISTRIDEQNSLFIVNSSSCGFDFAECLKELSVNVNAEGISLENGFLCVLPRLFNEASFEVPMRKMQEYFAKFHDRVFFKTYGLTKEQIVAVTDGISQKYPSALFQTETIALDSKTVLIFDNTSSKIEIDKAIKEFLQAFMNNVYAEDDVSLEQRLNEILRLRRHRIATAESMTGGAISAKIVSVEGASDVFYEGLVTYNTEAKETRLGVGHNSVLNYGVVSSEIAFEMAKGLLSTGKVDTAITITGYAGATRDESGKPEGLCFIGIGVEQNVEVYKYNFSGTRKQVIDCASNAGLFLMIKTLTNI